MTDQFIRITQQTGSYNFAEPDDVQTVIQVEIPEIPFNDRFTYDEGEVDVRGLPWDEALEIIVSNRTGYMRWEKKAEKLEQFLEDNRDRIRAKWEEHRVNEIDDKIDRLEEQRDKLM